MEGLIEAVGNEGVVEKVAETGAKFSWNDINSALHGYWLDEVYGDVVESPSDQDYFLDESYRQWCKDTEIGWED
jgi:hypothetical protein